MTEIVIIPDPTITEPNLYTEMNLENKVESTVRMRGTQERLGSSSLVTVHGRSQFFAALNR